MTIDLAKSSPEDTLAQFNCLPTQRAKLAISRARSSEAIEDLRAATTYELGQTSNTYGWTAVYPIYVCGKAYLAAHQDSEAAAEFQKIIGYREIAANESIGALAHLGLARGYAVQSDNAKARAASQEFLTMWKDADSGIPILIAAKAQGAKLQ